MVQYAAEVNEDIFHIFGYAKDDREDNTTPFIDYEGKARPENVAKTNYYKQKTYTITAMKNKEC